jgi:hypothetical protein
MATVTIDAENNIVAHTEVPDKTDNLQAFASEKELAKLAADCPASRLVETWNSFAGVAPTASEVTPGPARPCNAAPVHNRGRRSCLCEPLKHAKAEMFRGHGYENGHRRATRRR